MSSIDPSAASNPPLTIRFRFTKPELRSAMRAACFKRPLMIGPILFLLVLGLLNLVMVLFAGWDPVFTYMLWAGAALIVALQLWVAPLRVLRQPAFLDDQEWTFSDDGIAMHVRDAESSMKWAFFRKVTETKSFYLLRHGSGVFNIFPRRAFENPADEQEFRELVRRHGLARFPKA